MRLSGLSLAVLLTSSILFAQHSSGGGSSSSASSSSSSGGGSHSGSSGGSSYSGGSSSGSHSSGGGGSSHNTGSSHSSGGGHSSGGTHASSSGHVSGGASVSSRKGERGTTLVSSSHDGIESSSSKMTRPIREPKSGISERVVVPQKRGFFSFLRRPFRKPPKVVEAKPALYLPRPICPKGRCAPACPVAQVPGGGACTAPVIPVCTTGLGWNTQACGYSHHCALGQLWNGTSCGYGTRFLDSCIGLRTALERQARRVQDAEAARQRACVNGPRPECSDASASWQSEESMRQNLLRRYQQCRMQATPMYSAQYGPYHSTFWFDSLHFNGDF